ncbi:integrase core domain-containing protein [Mangrovicoccus ximenensis]|uniref:integrase core domain-containing protein n=1 Tax=Mangrovicoccus ximenensis TaxID=1911570 RepID=UPI000D3DC597|nr:integrase core domain-containing protein [Mangrovicoccus ximenensis]
MITDLWSRKVTGWEVHERESSENAAALLERAVWAEKCVTNPLVLHADNGSPLSGIAGRCPAGQRMKGATMKATMERLGITASYGWPRVGNDNPFSEAPFRTCKYRPGWPPRGFASIGAARDWVQGFVGWHNRAHRHSAIRFVTPEQRHCGEHRALLEKRRQVCEMARAARPERWSGGTRLWTAIGSVWLNPDRPDEMPRGHGAADALDTEAVGGGPMAGTGECAAGK